MITRTTNPDIPHLRRTGDTTQLIVDGQPFLILGGELQNSSFSSSHFMEDVYPKLAAANLNTVLGSVSWEQTEPEEGRFDFAELDRNILAARNNGLKLVLLWFGSFKNGALHARADICVLRLITSRRKINIRPIMGQDQPTPLPTCANAPQRRHP